MIDISTEKKVYLTPDILKDALDSALKAQSIKMLEDIKNNLKSMDVYEHGREIDSFQAKSKDWETPAGPNALASDSIKAPTKDNNVVIGSAVPYVGVNEMGDSTRPPRPAVRVAAHISNNTVAKGYNDILNKRLPK